MDGPSNPHDILNVLGEKALQAYLVNEIQKVYRDHWFTMTAARDKTRGIDQKLCLDERKELYKYQQANYDSFEKTLLTLAGSTVRPL